MISFVTSLYRSDKYLNKYIKKVKKASKFLKEKKVDFEFVIIVNDPTNKEKKLKKEFEGDNNFSVVEVSREPLYATWNRGIKMAKGDRIGFWNADDVRYMGSVIKAIKLLDAGADLVYFAFYIVWYLNIFGLSVPVKAKFIKPEIFDKKEFVRSMICGPFFIFKKELYEKVGPFDEQFKIVSDFDWCIRAAKVTDRFKLVDDESAGIFRVDGKGLSAGGKKRHIVEDNVVYIRHGVKEKFVKEFPFSNDEFKIDKILVKGIWSDLK